MFLNVYFCTLILIFIAENRATDTQVIQKINEFCVEYSTVARNRTKDIKLPNGHKITVSAYFLLIPYAHLYHEFLRRNPECQISLSTFKKHIPKKFIRGTRKRTEIREEVEEERRKTNFKKR